MYKAMNKFLEPYIIFGNGVVGNGRASDVTRHMKIHNPDAKFVLGISLALGRKYSCARNI